MYSVCVVSSFYRNDLKEYDDEFSSVSTIVIFTARKRSLRRLCFHRYLSVQRGEYLDRYTPLSRYPPGRDPSPGRYTPWAGTHPLGRYPRATVHAGIRSTSGRYASHWNAFLLIDKTDIKAKLEVIMKHL